LRFGGTQVTMDALAAAAAVAPGEVLMPTWSSIAQQRDLQAAFYIKRVERELRDGQPLPMPAVPAGEAAPDAAAAVDEPRRLRLLALLAKAFPTSTGMPDPAGWEVAFKSRGGNTFSHSEFCGGIKLYSLPQVAKRAAAVMAQAQEAARAQAAAGPAVVQAVVVDRAAGALAQVEQLLARNGVLADFAAEHRRATTVDGTDGQGELAAAADDGAGEQIDAEEEEEEEEEEERALTPLQAAVKARDACVGVRLRADNS
jgi:hypothetical protein